MAAHLDADQRIARRPAADASAALAAQAQRLAVLGAGGNGDIEGRAVGQGDAPRRAVYRIEKIDGERIAGIGPAHAEAGAARPRARIGARPEQIAEDVADIAQILVGAPAP